MRRTQIRAYRRHAACQNNISRRDGVWQVKDLLLNLHWRPTPRARSATEAFLYRRLETLPQTRGRFRLNAVLPIAFDGLGQLEVDLLCDDTPDTRIAVELDGDQHLADPTAYRRDRRKDVLLQENGCLVLRFLAQDVGRELDRVLDTILRALARGARLRSSAERLGVPPS